MSSFRVLGEDDLEAFTRQLGVGFHFQPAAGLAGYLGSTIELSRTYGSFDGETLVGTLRSFETELTMPGARTARASALTNVTVAPTHRRQGRLSSMIVADLRASAERGEPVGILVASEWPIYGRFGYGPAIEAARYAVDTKGLRFRDPPVGTVELCDRTTLRGIAPGVYERFRAAQPGAIGRNDAWWDRWLHQVEVPGNDPPTGQVVVYCSPTGTHEGYAHYVAKPEWDGMRPQGTLELRELVSTTTEAYAALWAFCAGVDLLTKIDAGQRPVDEVLPMLVDDGRAVKLTSRADFVWARVLDLRGALAARTYGAAGRLVLEVHDPLGLAQGRVVVEGGPDGATCSPSSEAPDLVVPVDALGSVLLGGVSPTSLLLAGRLAECRDGAAARADTMFRTSRAPWCNTWF